MTIIETLIQQTTPTLRKATELWNLGQLKSLRNSNTNSQEKLVNYSTKLEQITRPENNPRVFMIGELQEFEDINKEISNWICVQDKIVTNTILSSNLAIKEDAVKDTFFCDQGTFFVPSKYFSITSPNSEVIKHIESLGSSACGQNVIFDKGCYPIEKPNTSDPFLLESIDIKDPNQVLIGDKIMYPFLEDNQLKIKLIKLNI